MFQAILEGLKGLGGGFTKGVGQSSGLEFPISKLAMKKPTLGAAGKKKSQIETLLEQLARRK